MLFFKTNCALFLFLLTFRTSLKGTEHTAHTEQTIGDTGIIVTPGHGGRSFTGEQCSD